MMKRCTKRICFLLVSALACGAPVGGPEAFAECATEPPVLAWQGEVTAPFGGLVSTAIMDIGFGPNGAMLLTGDYCCFFIDFDPSPLEQFFSVDVGNGSPSGDFFLSQWKLDERRTPSSYGWTRTAGAAHRGETLAADSSGNVVTVGVFTGVISIGSDFLQASGPTDKDTFVARFDTNGSPQWARSYGDAFGFLGGHVAVHPTNGTSVIAAKGDSRWLIKLSSTGTELWARQILESAPAGVAMAPDGSIFVAHEDGAVSRHNANGDLIWTEPILVGASPANGISYCQSDASLLVAGSAGPIVKLETNGDVRWTSSYSLFPPVIGDYEMDADGNMLLTGGIVGPMVDLDPSPGVQTAFSGPARFLMRLEPDGTYNWADTTVNFDGEHNRLAIRDNGDVLLQREWTLSYYTCAVTPSDVDGDRTANVDDNCRNVFNQDQLDTDNDDVGDICDNCQFVPNVDQEDADADAIGDACDFCTRFLYWTEIGPLGTKRVARHAGFCGEDPEDLVATGLATPLGVATGRIGQESRVYWVDAGVAAIHSAILNDLTPEEIVNTNVQTPVAIAVDQIGGKLYWSDLGAVERGIHWSNLDGSDPQLIVPGVQARGIVTSAETGELFWTDSGATKVQKAALDGSGVTDVVVGQPGTNTPFAIAIDPEEQKLYWSDLLANEIRFAGFDGSGQGTLVSSVGNANGIAIDLETRHLYWTDITTDTIQRYDLTFDFAEQVITNLNDPAGLAIGRFAPPVLIAGDCDESGNVDLGDIPCFVNNLLGLGGDPLSSDVNEDGLTDGLDVQAFLTLLVGP